MRRVIAVDACGGDLEIGEDVHVPSIVGAVTAAEEFGLEIILTGPGKKVESKIQALFGRARGVSVFDAPRVIKMSDRPVEVRHWFDSSVAVGLKLVKLGLAEAFVSGGNTGAVVTIAFRTLGRIKGIERPSLACTLPTKAGPLMLLDMGAVVDCESSWLSQWGTLGSLYMAKVYGIETPRVGLLNIGEEVEKGNQLTKEADGLLKESGLNYLGNVEGKDLAEGIIDVVVCDGFVGNVTIKTMEGVAKYIGFLLKEELTKDLRSKVFALGLKSNFRSLKERLDYANHSGAILLGVNGVCVIAHGRSNAKAIKHAVLVALQTMEGGVTEAIASGFAQREALESVT